MQPRVLNDWQLGLAIVIGLIGSFLGAAQAQSGIIEKWYPAWTYGDAWLVSHRLNWCYLLTWSTV
jgi:hypothetical protein